MDFSMLFIYRQYLHLIRRSIDKLKKQQPHSVLVALALHPATTAMIAFETLVDSEAELLHSSDTVVFALAVVAAHLTPSTLQQIQVEMK